MADLTRGLLLCMLQRIELIKASRFLPRPLHPRPQLKSLYGDVCCQIQTLNQNLFGPFVYSRNSQLEAVTKMFAYAQDVYQRKLAKPSDDLASQIVHAEVDGRRCSRLPGPA